MPHFLNTHRDTNSHEQSAHGYESATSGVSSQGTSTESSDNLGHTLTHHLRPNSVLKLSAHTGMVLVVVQGAAWVTLGLGPHGASAGCRPLHPCSGDDVVNAGEAMPVVAGTYVVLEPIGDEQLHFAWVRQAQTTAAKVSKRTGLASTALAMVRRYALADLRQRDWRQQVVCA
jgi:hypothetical protein